MRIVLRSVLVALLLLCGSAFVPVRAQPSDTSDVPTTQVEAGNFHTCALTTAGGIKCWGNNSSGQFGAGNTTSSNAAIDVPNLSSAVAALTAGESHTCALTMTGAVKCWGYNADGQLGDGTTENSSTPVDILDLSTGVAAITVGYYHSCALTVVGAVKCWGYNGHGALGNGNTTSSASPVDVSGSSSGVLAITAGGSHTCALTTAGGVKCWGRNHVGQLGNGTTENSSMPVDVSGLSSGVVAIAAARFHTCALTSAGAVKCWGYNFSGELGNGSDSLSISTPVDVSGLGSGVAAITTGDAHTCAMTTTGAVKCWGYNNDGQLGNDSTSNAATPVDVLDGMTSQPISGVAAITAGAWHTCALTAVGGVKCWGINDWGQLGNHSNTSSSTPVDVSSLSAIPNGQSIAFTPSPRVSTGTDASLLATASGGGSVSFDTWTPGTCTVSGNILTLTSVGLCGVRASQAGGSDGMGGTIAAAPQQLRLIEVEVDSIFANGFDASTGFSP